MSDFRNSLEDGPAGGLRAKLGNLPMKDYRTTLRNYAELARVSNAPTIVTNVLVGCAAAARGGDLRWGAMLAMIVAVGLMYSAGMALNDVLDSEVDRLERPGRPIPSGRISRRHALIAAICGLAAGIIIAGLFSVPALFAALILAALIVLYDLLHRLASATVVLMGVCRAMAYIVPALAANPEIDRGMLTVPAVVIASYIIVVSLVARFEVGGSLEWRRILAMFMPLIVLAPAAMVRSHRAESSLPALIAAIVAVAWTAAGCWRLFRKPPMVIVTVLSWLAGICLVDAFMLSLFGRFVLAGVAYLCFALTIAAHRRIPGT